MKYKVTSRNDWDNKLFVKFGERDSVHELSDSEIVEAIVLFGRAEITQIDIEIRQIDFQNDYD